MRLQHTSAGDEAAEATQARASVQARLAPAFGERLGAAVSFATTEHFNLQTAPAATVSEANGRASLYLAALSSHLIALAFIGQMSQLGTAFYAFALVLLPVLAFVGVVTFQRLVQLSIEDWHTPSESRVFERSTWTLLPNSSHSWSCPAADRLRRRCTARGRGPAPGS